MCTVTVYGSAGAISLDEVIEIALEHDAQLQAENLSAEARNAEGWGHVAGYGPTLDGSGSYMQKRDAIHPDEDAEMEDRVANYYEKELTLELRQPVIDLEKASIAMRGIREMTLAELEKKKAREELLLRVHERYYHLLAARQNLQLAEAETNSLHNQLESIREKVDLGFGTITDQNNAEARYRLSLAEEIKRDTGLQNAKKALEEIIGRRLPGEVEDLGEDAALPNLPLAVADWLERAFKSNTDLNLKKMQTKISLLDLQAAESRFLPALVFFADYSENHPDGGLLGYGEERNEFQMGLRVEANLLSGGRNIAATAAASHRTKEAKRRVEVARRAVKRSVHSLWESITGARQLIEAYRLAVDANKMAMDSTRAAYDEGAKVLLDVLNAQQDYFRSLREYKTTRYDYMILLERFRQVVGVEDVSSLQEKDVATTGFEVTNNLNASVRQDEVVVQQNNTIERR